MSVRRKLLVAIPFVLLLAVAGCKVNTINYFPPHPATVRVINLMPEAAGIDVQIGGQPAFSAVGFQSLTGYQSYDNVATPISVNLTGSSTSLFNFSFNFAGEQPYTLVVYGSLTNPAVTLLSEVASAPTNGNVQLSVFNAAINQTGVDIYVTTPGVDITTVSPNYGGVGYNGVSLNLAFAPGTYQIRITTQGTKTVIYDSGGSVLTPNIALTLIAYSKGSGVLVNAAVLQSQGPGGTLDNIFARIKDMNGASVVGPVNQLLGTTTVVANLGYASASTYNQVLQGLATVNFEATATPGATIASTQATLGAATDVSAFVTGLPGAQQAFVLNDLNLPPASGNVRLRFVNTSWNSNPLSVSINNVAQASAVAFPTASAYVQLAAATVTITFTDATTGAEVLTLNNVVLIAGQTSTVYVIGPAGALGGVVTQDN
jgi:Domain of unknown function (DUF4397)